MMPGGIEVKGLNKEFRSIHRKVTALRDISLKIEKEEFFVILGPSGCGKSTMLNILSGLEKQTGGDIWFGDKLVASSNGEVFLTPKERNVAMVFQSYALYPHMNVQENVAFPLKIAKVSKPEMKNRIDEVTAMLDIENLLHAKPKELSGGQRQRVAIARALVRKPSVFLLDEPLSNLDARLRVRLREELKNLQRKLGVTTIYVTHDQVEAMTLGSRIAILKDGKIQQVGGPLEVYKNPLNIFVAGFIGTPPMNLIKVEIIEQSGRFFISKDQLKIELNSNINHFIQKLRVKEVTAGIRPEDIKIEENEGEGVFETDVRFVEYLGSEEILYFKIGEDRMLAKWNGDKMLKEGDRIKFSINPEKIYIFDENGNNIQ